MTQPPNPLLFGRELPDFAGVRPEDVLPAIEKFAAELEQGVAAIETSTASSFDEVVGALVEVEEPLQRAWDTVEHLVRVRTREELRKAHGQAQPKVVAARLRVGQSRPLLKKLQALTEGDGWSSLTPSRQRAVKRRLLEAELAGVGLDGAAQERFGAIETELSELTTAFGNRVLDATKAFKLTVEDADAVVGLPAGLLDQAARTALQDGHDGATADAGPWVFGLDYPSMGPFLKSCRRRDLRETMYRAHVTRASDGDLDNRPTIARILELRLEKARLLGRRSFAEVSLATKMADSTSEVRELLDHLHARSEQAARDELNELAALARAEPDLGVPADDVQPWDEAYLAEALRERRFAFTDEDTRPYFPLERVLEGLFRLVKDLFGVDVEPAEAQTGVWHDDVRTFRVLEGGREVARFFLDPYSRPEDKRGGAWMDDCRGRRVTPSGVQLPVAHLVCNQTGPRGEVPSLMTFGEVTTLFHEFGHGLQHMLTRVDELDVSGINGVEWDAVELPSQFMENWCYRRDVVHEMSGHHETGAPLPQDLFEKISQARTFRAASQMLRQIYYARLDLALHDVEEAGAPAADVVQREVASQTLVLQPIPEDHLLCGFTHLFSGGYAAGYYSYKWAEVLAADAYGAFEDAGLDDDEARRETGKRFRETVLSLGGSRPPAEVFEAFRGRPPSPEALLRHCGLAEAG